MEWSGKFQNEVLQNGHNCKTATTSHKSLVIEKISKNISNVKQCW